MAEFDVPAIYPSFDLVPHENPLRDGGKWGEYHTRPPLKASYNGHAIHGTVEFPVNGSVYLAKIFQGDIIEAYGCAPGSGLGAALESHRIVALIGDPNTYNGYSSGHGGGIGSSYFFRRYDNFGFTGIGETGTGPGNYPEKLGIRITPTHVQQWGYYSGAWHLIHDVEDDTHRGPTWIALETEEQGGIEEVGWTCFGAGVPNRTQIYRLVQGQKAVSMLEFCDSFDHYNNSYLYYKWTGADLGGVAGVSAVGRFGTNGYSAGGRRQIYKTLPGGSKAERIFGFAAYSTFSPGSNWAVLKLLDSGSWQVELRFGTSGVMEVARNGTLIPGAVGTTAILPNQYYYYEMRVVHHNTLGEVEVRVNGNVEFALTNVDTQATGNASSNQMWFFDHDIGSTTMYIDDIYVLDNVDSGIPGCPNNDFLGDIKVECKFPNGNGATSQWVGQDSNSVDNYLNVDESSSPDDDTTYNESGTIGYKDTHAYTNLAAASGTIFGIQQCPWARKTDAGARSIATVARVGAVEEDSANLNLSSGYAYFFNPRDGDPNGDQWTAANIDAAEFGHKVTV